MAHRQQSFCCILSRPLLLSEEASKARRKGAPQGAYLVALIQRSTRLALKCRFRSIRTCCDIARHFDRDPFLYTLETVNQEVAFGSRGF
jgi:hypothetical protein